jgi:hypothetical protein
MKKTKDSIPYDGFSATIEMLRVSDQAFREKILRGIAQRDRALAERLLLALRNESSFDESLERLGKSQRAHQTKNYGL